MCEIVLAKAKFEGCLKSWNAGNWEYQKPRPGNMEWLHWFRPVFVKFIIGCLYVV